MNKWNQSGIPHNGWVCDSVYDTGSDDSSCEMCGRERIRYVHVMSHPEFNGRLDVGCVCAEKMSGDYEGPRERENSLHNRAERRKKWLKRKWRVSEMGNEFLNVDGFNIVIFPSKGRRDKLSFKVGDEFSKIDYVTSDHAKLAAFDMFWKKAHSHMGHQDEKFPNW